MMGFAALNPSDDGGEPPNKTRPGKHPDGFVLTRIGPQLTSG